MIYSTTITEKASKAFGKRIGAGLIDLVLWVVLFIVAAANFGTTRTVVNGDAVTKQVSLTGWPFVVFSCIALAYFTLMEWRFGGSLGKLLLRVQVVNAKGGRITLQQSLIRNVLRAVDGFPFVIPYLVGLIVIASGNSKQRLGDKAAKSLVVGTR